MTQNINHSHSTILTKKKTFSQRLKKFKNTFENLNICFAFMTILYNLAKEKTHSNGYQIIIILTVIVQNFQFVSKIYL